MSDSTAHDDRWFAAIYSRISRSGSFRREMDPWRQKLLHQARGVVLEVGAGGGQNFALYDPAITERVEAVEPNSHMRRQAEVAAQSARVPIHLTHATAEKLPFPDAMFDTVLATLVFCSVDVPLQGLREMRRVLKPAGTLLLFEHVRSPKPGWARLQDWMTPVQRRVAGNCHLNRATPDLVRRAGFIVHTEEWSGGAVHPMVLIVADRGAEG